MLSLIRVKMLAFFLILVLVPTILPTTAQDTSSGSLQLVSFNVTYGGRVYDSVSNQTTFTYVVTGTGTPPDLSHFDVEIPICAPPLLVVGYEPTDAVSFGADPTTSVNGIKWDLPLNTDETRTYTLTFNGNVVEGSVQVAVKGDTFEVGSLPGPSCVTSAINVNKLVSSDGSTWDDADDAPGLQVDATTPVSFSFVVTNIGNVDLTNITLTDSVYDTSTCVIPATLSPNASFDCVIGPVNVDEGQHINVASVSAESDGQITTDTDVAYVLSGDIPMIVIDKFVSTDGGTTWLDNSQVLIGGDVFYKFVVTNTGNVELSNLSLADSSFDTSSCVLTAALAPDASYECVIGPFPAGSEAHTNTATVTATFEDQTVTATDTASYQPVEDESDLDVIVVIEGPVETIDVNIITIFGMEIQIDPNDPILTVVRVGDTIRVEGNMISTGPTIIIVAVNITIINANIVIVGPPGGPIVVPAGCKITGLGGNNPHLKCSKKSHR